MTERTPVTTVADLNTLDEAEIIEGYHDGREGFPCGENRSRSYWHGWRNGMADSGRVGNDSAQQALAHEVVQGWRTDHG
jgi:hypothetical protein